MTLPSFRIELGVLCERLFLVLPTPAWREFTGSFSRSEVFPLFVVELQVFVFNYFLTT